MWYHSSVLCEGNTKGSEIKQIGQEEADALVWQRRIAYGRTPSLILLCKKLFRSEMLVRGISPPFMPGLQMPQLRRGLGKPVSHKLFFYPVCINPKGNRAGKNTYLIWNASGFRTDEIGQAEAWLVTLGMLLAQKRNALPVFHKYNVFTFRVGFHEPHTEGSKAPLLVPLTQ